MTPRPIAKARLLLLAFRLPEHPSRYRVSVWRRLRRAGARSLHRGLFALADTPLNRLRALDLAHDVEAWGGKSTVFLGAPLADRWEGEQTEEGRSRRRTRRRTRGKPG